MAKKNPQSIASETAAQDVLRTAIDHLDQGIVIIDAKGLIQAFNNAHKSLLGLPDDVIGVGQPFSRVIEHLASIGAFGPGDPKKISRQRVKDTKAGKLNTEELFLPDGTIVEVQRSILPDGGMVAVTTDVTERHQAATALKASEERFRDFADVASDWFWEMDADLRFSYFSDRHKQVLGINLDTLLGKRRRDLSQEPTNTEKWQAHLADLDAHRPFRNFRYEIATGPDTSRHISLDGKPIFDGEGNFQGYRGVGRDITEENSAQHALLESNSILEATLDATADGLLVVDTDRNILATNQRLRDMWGIPEKILKQNDGFALRDWIADQVEDKEAFIKRVEAHYKDNSLNSLDRLHMKDGRVFERFAQPQYMNDEIVGRVISIRDVTAQVRAETGIQTALETAEKANRTKSEFLANVSHDLRTPLNAILGFTEMMKLQILGPLGSDKYREYAADIQDSGRYLLDLVNDLLDISTIEAGRRQLAREVIDIADLVDECAKTAAGQDADKVPIITTKIADNLPAVMADRRALKQIILNLLSNAVRFTPKTGRISVSVKLKKDRIDLTIKDTGKGIPKSHLSRITAAFERGQAHPYSTADGTGLGLAIARSLVEMHGGELSISSQVGKGTAVTVRLPLDE